MAGLPQLTTFNVRDIDRSIQMDRMYRDFLERSRAPLVPRTAEDDAFDAWAARQGAAEAKVSLDEFGGKDPIYGGDDNDWMGAAGLFGSLVSGVMGSRAASKATQTQVDALNRATALHQKNYDQTRTDLAPYRERAAPARNQLAVMMGLTPDAQSYGNRDPKQDPMWGSGYRTAPQYSPNTTYQPMQGGFGAQPPLQRNNPAQWTNALGRVLSGMKK